MKQYKRVIENIMLKGNKQQINDGLLWYTRLNRHCRDLALIYNVPQYKVTAIMSILSPMTSFANNLHDTEKMLKYGLGARKYLKSPLCFDKACKAYTASSYDEINSLFSERTGRKTLSFWDNMTNKHSNRATIDVHMIRHLGIKGSLTDKKYREAEKALQEYSNKIGVKPYQLQACLWCIVRGKSFR